MSQQLVLNTNERTLDQEDLLRNESDGVGFFLTFLVKTIGA